MAKRAWVLGRCSAFVPPSASRRSRTSAGSWPSAWRTDDEPPYCAQHMGAFPPGASFSMPEPTTAAFDKDVFESAYTDAAASQANVIAGAFATVDARLDRIERVLAAAFPDEYRAACEPGAEAGQGVWS